MEQSRKVIDSGILLENYNEYVKKFLPMFISFNTLTNECFSLAFPTKITKTEYNPSKKSIDVYTEDDGIYAIPLEAFNISSVEDTSYLK